MYKMDKSIVKLMSHEEAEMELLKKEQLIDEIKMGIHLKRLH